MQEPISDAAANVFVFTGGALTLSGSVLGLGYGVFVVGLAGAVFAMSFHPRSSWFDRIVNTFIAGVFAGYMSPIVVAGIKALPATNWLPVEGAQYLVALIIGYTWQGILAQRIREGLAAFSAKKVKELEQ